MNALFLIQLISAHLVSDFILQPGRWVVDRKNKHWKSGFLYMHCATTAFIAWIFTGFLYWQVPLVLFVSHLVVDVWKSYRNNGIVYFIIDQAVHLVVIFWLWIWLCPVTLTSLWEYIVSLNHVTSWTYAAGAIFLTQPASVLISLLTKRWREQIEENNDSLEKAGRWIGILERLIVLVLVINRQYEAIGLLIAAKSILRFNETRGAQMRTEYLLIGTLISMAIAIMTGLLIIASLP